MPRIMTYWLIKSEPESYGWADLVRDGGTEWDGVRNNAARLHLKAMKPGDEAFLYHSMSDKAVVGIVEIAKLFRPDPSDESGKFGMVDIRAVKPMPKPVTLESVKAEPRLAKMALVANSRLSVQPVTDEEWAIVCEMGGMETAT